MKTRRLLPIAVLVLLAGFAWGCGEDPVDPDPFSDFPPPPPESLVINLQTAYERREIEQYAKLLDPDFRFYFQQADIPAGIEREYWSRDEDSTGTGALFDATLVSKIILDLGAFAVEDSVRVEDPGVKRIRLTHVMLEVELISGTTLLVQGDIQDMYFRKGSVEAGTDSTKWYLFEWHDLPGGGGKPASRTLDQTVPAAASVFVEANSWGRIKSMFR